MTFITQFRDMLFSVSPMILIGSLVALLLIIILIVFALKRRGKGGDGYRKIEDEKSAFLALSSHYLLTPLSIIRGTLSELTTPGSTATTSPAELQKRYTVMQASADKLLLIIQNIITASVIDQKNLQLSLQATDLGNVLDQCINTYHAQAMLKGVELQFRKADSLLAQQIQADPEKLKQAIMNVLDNAVKFTPEGGSVSVALTSPDTNRQQSFMITVADSGVGIPQSRTNDLFKPFSRGTSFLQLDYEGLGLGLYIAKYIIEAHGGTLTLESKENQGTFVQIVLVA